MKIQAPSYDTNPNRINLDSWNQANNRSDFQEQREQGPVSQVGINSLKGKLYNEQQPLQLSNTSKTSINIVSSHHESSNFNSRPTAPQIVVNSSSNAQHVQQTMSEIEPKMHQHTVQFKISQPNQPKIVEPAKPASSGAASIQYQIFDDNDIAASDL